MMNDIEIFEAAVTAINQKYPKRRSRIIVEIDLDPVPGWGDNPEDHQRMIQHYLNETIKHYHPAVTIDS